jgi:deoxyribonucleoside regulator
MDKKDSHSNILATLVQVARLYYEGNLSQQEIALQMGVSRSLIAHYLKMARDRDLVRIKIDDPRSTCTDIARELQQRTGLKNVVVVTGSQASTTFTRRAVARRRPWVGLGSDQYGSNECDGPGNPAPDRSCAVDG